MPTLLQVLLSEFNAALQSATFATIDNADTLTNKTFTSPTINGGTMSGSFTGTLDVTGTVLSAASPLVFEGASQLMHTKQLGHLLTRQVIE